MKPEPGFYPEMKRCKKCGFMLHERYFGSIGRGRRLANCNPCRDRLILVGIDDGAAKQRRQVKALQDWYIRKVLKDMGWRVEEITPEVIAKKREQIKMSREQKELQRLIGKLKAATTERVSHGN